jgi:hypothetical protein
MPSMWRESRLRAVDRPMRAKRANSSHDCRTVVSIVDSLWLEIRVRRWARVHGC